MSEPVSTHADKNRRLDEFAARARALEADLAKALAIIREVLDESPVVCRKSADNHTCDDSEEPQRDSMADWIEKRVTRGSWLDAADLLERYPAPVETVKAFVTAPPPVAFAPETRLDEFPSAEYRFSDSLVLNVPRAFCERVAGGYVGLLSLDETRRRGGLLSADVPPEACWAIVEQRGDGRWAAVLYYGRDLRLIEPAFTSPATPRTAPPPAP